MYLAKILLSPNARRNGPSPLPGIFPVCFLSEPLWSCRWHRTSLPEAGRCRTTVGSPLSSLRSRLFRWAVGPRSSRNGRLRRSPRWAEGGGWRECRWSTHKRWRGWWQTSSSILSTHTYRSMWKEMERLQSALILAELTLPLARTALLLWTGISWKGPKFFDKLTPLFKFE